jgi:bifunctional DNase/RNase
MVSLKNYQRVVLLKERAAERYLPIWVGSTEAEAIAVKLQSVEVPRPLSHDLLLSVIEALDASINSVVITELRAGTFYSVVVLDAPEGKRSIDSRPSDALALALRAQAPIFSEDTVLDEVGLLIDRETGQISPHEVSQEKGITQDELQGLSAYSDFIDTLNLDDLGKGTTEEE